MQQHVRGTRTFRANRSSAGGLSGTNYKVLRAWYSDADEIADTLTVVLNRSAAGDVPN